MDDATCHRVFRTAFERGGNSQYFIGRSIDSSTVEYYGIREPDFAESQCACFIENKVGSFGQGFQCETVRGQ